MTLPSIHERNELRALRAAAEPGRWIAVQDLHGDNAVAVEGYERSRRIADVRALGPDYGQANARYLAAAAGSIMDVLDALEAVESERDELRARLAISGKAGAL